jgi:putative endonuclease
MYKVYVLKSLKTGKNYIGYTSKSIEKRLAEHNRKCNKWDRGNSPFRLIHYEEFQTKEDATQKEKFYKSGQGRKLLKSLIVDKI